jgi:hypothetical protein
MPNGLLISGSFDNAIKVWDVSRGGCVRELSGHEGFINSLIALPDGRLASGSSDKTIKLWNLETGECEKTFSCSPINYSIYKGYVRSLALLPDGRLASGLDTGIIKLWNVRSGVCERMLSGMGACAILSIIALPGGRLAACGKYLTKIFVLNVSSGVVEMSLSGHTGDGFSYAVNSLTILPDGRLASGASDKTIKIWNLASGMCERTLSGHESDVTSLIVLPDGRLASGSSTEIKLWNLARMECEETLFNRSSDPELRGMYANLTVFSDGRIVSGFKQNMIKLWGSPEFEVKALPPAAVTSSSSIASTHLPLIPQITIAEAIDCQIHLLRTGDVSIKEKAIKALGDFLSIENQEIIRKKRVIPMVVDAIKDPNEISVKEEAMRFLSSSAISDYQNDVVAAGGISVIVSCLGCWGQKYRTIEALRMLSRKNVPNQEAIKKSGAISCLIKIATGDSLVGKDSAIDYLRELGCAVPQEAAASASRAIATLSYQSSPFIPTISLHEDSIHKLISLATREDRASTLRTYEIAVNPDVLARLVALINVSTEADPLALELLYQLSYNYGPKIDACTPDVTILKLIASTPGMISCLNKCLGRGFMHRADNLLTRIQGLSAKAEPEPEPSRQTYPEPEPSWEDFDRAIKKTERDIRNHSGLFSHSSVAELEDRVKSLKKQQASSRVRGDSSEGCSMM